MATINIYSTEGIVQNLPHTQIGREACTQLDNYVPSYLETNASELVSFMQKSPSHTAYLDKLSTYNGRGLYQFANYAGTTLYTLYANSNGDIHQSGSTTWNSTKLVSGLTALNHIEFASFVRKDTKDVVCLMTDGSAVMRKWNPAVTTAGYAHNKNENGTLTGTLTFYGKGTTQVDGSDTAFTTELQVGDVIRPGDYMRVWDEDEDNHRQEIAAWGQVDSITSDTVLHLTQVWGRSGSWTNAMTTVSGVNTAQKQGSRVTGTGGTGTTVTFTTGDATVTCLTGIDFTSALEVGQYIRPSSTAIWYEVASITNATALELTQTYKENTETSGSNLCQKSVRLNTYRFMYPFKVGNAVKMIYACDITKTDYSKWVHSVVGDAENVPGLNLDIIPTGESITGVGQCGTYAVVFTERNYYVYSYVPEIDDFVKKAVGYVGCISSKTIKEIPGGLIWLSLNGIQKLTISEGLYFEDKVKLELDLVSAGVLNSSYYSASGSQLKMPQAEIDNGLGYYYLSYALTESKNSYLLTYDYRNKKCFRQTAIYAGCLLLQRVSGGASRLIYGTANTDGYTYSVDSQSLINSVLTAGATKWGYWSLPLEDGSIALKKFTTATLKVMVSNTFEGSISLNHKTDWDVSGSGKTTSSGTLTNATSYVVKTIVYPINQNAHAIQFSLSDSITTGGYGIIGLSVEYDNLGGTKYV